MPNKSNAKNQADSTEVHEGKSTLDNFKNPAKRSPAAKADFRDSIQPAPPPEIGFNTQSLEAAIAAGPSGVRNAQRIAINHAKRFMVASSEKWKLVTPFLESRLHHLDTEQRAYARHALHWRPRFLAALAMTNSVLLSSRHAKVSRGCAYLHRKDDPDFAKQWDAAIEDALELLHSRVWQRSLEGDIEPVWYMGVPVAYIRKFDSKLQIELLRAWKPDRFKTAGVNVNVGARGDVFVLTEDQRHELRSINRQFLLDSPVIDAEFEKLPET
jgi:hypothetical protein